MSAVAQPSLELVRFGERKRRIVVLLETRFDYLPSPRIVGPASSSGPADSGTVPCDVCHGRGRVAYGKGKPRPTRLCLGCDGSGQRRARRDDPAYDMNLEPGRQRLRVDGHPRVMTVREYDRELAMLERQLPRDRPLDDPYGWERARRRRDAAGSYRLLDLAVTLLRRYRPGLPVTSEPALYAIHKVMGPVIRVPDWLQPELHAARVSVALELHGYGWSAGEIARALGVGRDKVGTMLRSDRAPRNPGRPPVF